MGLTWFLGLIAVSPVVAGTDSVTRLPNEADRAFVERAAKEKLHSPDGGAPQIINTKKLVKGQEVLVAFTEHVEDKSNPGEFALNLQLLLPLKQNAFDRSSIEACEIEGGSPTLRTFFFANADSDPALEIGVICGWDARHESDCPQTDEVRFFKIKKEALGQARISPLEVKTSVFYENRNNGGIACRTPKFKTAADVKTLLKKLGYH